MELKSSNRINLSRKQQTWHNNAIAFIEVLDWYKQLKTKKSLSTVDYNKNDNDTSINRAKPNSSDFFCDVEMAIESAIPDRILLTKVIQQYILEDDVLDQHQKSYVEQQIGRTFRRRKLSPLSGYFRTIRK